MIKRLLTVYLPAGAVITTAIVAGALLYQESDPELEQAEFGEVESQNTQSEGIAEGTEVTEDAEINRNISADDQVQEEIQTESQNTQSEGIAEGAEVTEDAESNRNVSADGVGAIQELTPIENVPTTEPIVESEIVVTLSGPGVAKRCEVPFSETISVHQLMKQASSQCNFHYYVKDYTSLGAFVDELAGVSSDQKHGKYWIYYVNGKKANVGVSTYQVQPNDLIAWKYEQEY